MSLYRALPLIVLCSRIINLLVRDWKCFQINSVGMIFVESKLLLLEAEHLKDGDKTGHAVRATDDSVLAEGS